MSEWLEAGDEAIATALEVLDEQRQMIEEETAKGG